MNASDQNEDEGTNEAEEMSGPEPRQVVSMAYELATLQDAVGATRILADAIRSGSLDDDDEIRRAISGLSAILSLVACRLRDLGRVAAGVLDPLAILAIHNEALPDLAGDGEVEVRLRAWGPRKRLRRLREEVLQVRAQVAASKPAKRQRAGP